MQNANEGQYIEAYNFSNFLIKQFDLIEWEHLECVLVFQFLLVQSLYVE